MQFENIPTEPSLNDFYIQLNVMLAKWTSEGNKDVEPSLVMDIKIQVESQKISPKEGIERLYAIDAGRIER